MNTIDRRSVVRSASVLFALPFTGALLPAYASEQAEIGSVSQGSRVKLSETAPISVSLDLVNFVKDHSARTVAARYLGNTSDHSALGDQFHLLGKHLSQAGADKAVKAHCKKMLKAGTVPTIDPKAVAGAVSSVRAYAPSYSARELLSTAMIPSTPQEWTVQLKKLKKHGLVKYLHRAGRQLNAMGRSAHDRALEVSSPDGAGQYKPAWYDPTDSTQAAHLVEICSLSQKLKFFACIGAIVAVGLLILAAVVAACGATALAACFGGAGAAAYFFTVFGIVSIAALAACVALLSSYRKKAGQATELSAI
jgi:hypothetical protein